MARISWKKFFPTLLENPLLVGTSRQAVEKYWHIYQSGKALSSGKKSHLKSIQERLDRMDGSEAKPHVDAIKAALDHPQASVVLTQWDRGFLESIMDSLIKGWTLTSNQERIHIQILEKMSRKSLDKRQALVDAMQIRIKTDQTYRAQLEQVASYYKTHCCQFDYGFSQAVHLAIHSPAQFAEHHMDKINRKMSDRYAARVIENMAKQPKYAVNSHVTLNSLGLTSSASRALSNNEWIALRENGGFVIAHNQIVSDSVIGGNYYTILLIEGGVIQTQERFLKKYPKNK